jgi:hypothetical protein
LLENKLWNITLELIRIVDLDVDFFDKWDEERYNAFVSITHVVNSTFVFPISLLLVSSLIPHKATILHLTRLLPQ